MIHVLPHARESKATYVKLPKKSAKPKKKRVTGKPKAPRKPKVPKTRCSNTMSESAFWSFIRSCLRQKSRRWKPIYQALEAARRPSKSTNKRLKWEFICEVCKDWFAQANIQADHRIPCGSLRSGKDLEGFVERLFVEKDGFRIVCKECHQEITNEQRRMADDNAQS